MHKMHTFLLLSIIMPAIGIEPILCFHNRILSPARLPVPPRRHMTFKAGKPEHANRLYEYIIEQTRQSLANVQTGIFGADMKVSLVNDGPFTIMLDSEELF